MIGKLRGSSRKYVEATIILRPCEMVYLRKCARCTNIFRQYEVEFFREVC